MHIQYYYNARVCVCLYVCVCGAVKTMHRGGDGGRSTLVFWRRRSFAKWHVERPPLDSWLVVVCHVPSLICVSLSATSCFLFFAHKQPPHRALPQPAGSLMVSSGRKQLLLFMMLAVTATTTEVWRAILHCCWKHCMGLVKIFYSNSRSSCPAK